uniref:Uncharacterized protein n=1 Tax=Ditylenchus dipsaci TaxID=166011 RepID=A0A915EP40_9BILA
MNRETQKALALLCCHKGYLSLLNLCLENGYSFDYLPLSLSLIVKTCQMRQYSNWSAVVENLDVLSELFGKSEISFLVKTAKFRACLVEILLVLKHINFEDPCTMLLAECSISFFIEDYQGSKNSHNRKLAANTVKAFRALLDDEEGVEVFKKTVHEQLEGLMRPLQVLLLTLQKLVTESYMMQNKSITNLLAAVRS